MAEQFENMRARYIGKYTLSNWGVLQTTAICAGYAWFGPFLPAGLEDWAWDELEQELELQILEDGAHWEQSAMYHVEVLNTCTKLLLHLLYAPGRRPDPVPQSTARPGPARRLVGRPGGCRLSRPRLMTGGSPGGSGAQCGCSAAMCSIPRTRPICSCLSATAM